MTVPVECFQNFQKAFQFLVNRGNFDQGVGFSISNLEKIKIQNVKKLKKPISSAGCFCMNEISFNNRAIE